MGGQRKHLVRAVILLAVAIVAFLSLREALTPVSFGQFDLFHREDTRRWTSQPLVFSHTSRCNDCHSSVYARWEQSVHRGVSCENCHGPGIDHIETGSKLTVNRNSELCQVCHEKLASRPAGFPQVASAVHSPGVSCISCHNPHSPSLKQAPKLPDMFRTLSDCTSCHREGGLKPLPESHNGRGPDTCITCHRPEVVGPTPTPTPMPSGFKPTYTPTPAPIAPSPIFTPEPAETPSTPTATPAPARSAPRVPHTLEGRSDCLLCHGPQGFKPNPPDHEGRSKETCLACHGEKKL